MLLERPCSQFQLCGLGYAALCENKTWKWPDSRQYFTYLWINMLNGLILKCVIIKNTLHDTTKCNCPPCPVVGTKSLKTTEIAFISENDINVFTFVPYRQLTWLWICSRSQVSHVPFYKTDACTENIRKQFIKSHAAQTTGAAARTWL